MRSGGSWVTQFDPGVWTENIPCKQCACLQIKAHTISNQSRECLQAAVSSFHGSNVFTHTKK